MPCQISDCEVKVIEACSQYHEGKEPCDECQKECSSGSCFDGCLKYYDGNIPDYSCDFLRYAYVLRYFYVHKAEIRKLLEMDSDEIKRHLSVKTRTKELSFAAIGAGPGSDFAGFIEWTKIYIRNRQFPLRLLRIDKENDWIHQYDIIRDSYAPVIDEMGIKIAFRKVIGDVLDKKIVFKPFDLDIVSFSYILSEFPESKRKFLISSVFSKLLASLKEKSIIVLNDRPEQTVVDSFEYVFNLVQAEHPRSTANKYCFATNLAWGDRHFQCWCSSFYPNVLRDRYQPKLNCNSSQMIIYVDKS